MRPTMPIDIVPVAQPPSFALAMGDKLSPPQFNEGRNALTARASVSKRLANALANFAVNCMTCRTILLNLKSLDGRDLIRPVFQAIASIVKTFIHA